MSEEPKTVTFGETKSTVGITQAGDPPVVQTTPETTFIIGEDNLLMPENEIVEPHEAEVETTDFEPEVQKEDSDAGLEGHSALAQEFPADGPHHTQGAVGITDDLKILNERMGYPIDEPAMGPEDHSEEVPSEEAVIAGQLEASGHPVGEELTAEDKAAAAELEKEAEADAEEAEPVSDDSGVPTEENTVAEIKEFLDREGIAYTSSQTKAELLELVP